MKFLRAAARALFYDYPLSRIGDYLANKDGKSFLETLIPVIGMTENNFTMSEIRQFHRVVCDDWLGEERGTKAEGGKISFEEEIKRSFRILSRCGKTFLDIGDGIPLVKFPQLLRWRELTVLTGEDLITVATLAETDRERGLTWKDRSTYEWPDILNHNNKELNRVLDTGLTDTHAHLFSSGDTFHFNWMALMNDVSVLEKCGEHLTSGKYMQDYDPITIFSEEKYSMKEWCLVAAYIRCMLFSSHIGLDDISQEIERKLNSFFSNSSDFLIYKWKTGKAPFFELKNYISRVREKEYAGNNIPDYTMTKWILGHSKDESTPYVIHSGERHLLYRTFEKIQDNLLPARSVVYFYLYLLIKNKVRREIIHTNGLLGFENFQRYDAQKHLLLNEDYVRLQTRYAVLSSLFEKNNCLEGRICLDKLDDIVCINFDNSILDSPDIVDSKAGDIEDVYKDIKESRKEERGEIVDKGKQGCSREDEKDQNIADERIGKIKGKDSEPINGNRLTIVVHFLKGDLKKSEKKKMTDIESPIRFIHKRVKLWREMDTLLQKIEKNEGLISVTGIDVAGSELNMRPEIFAPMFRWARYCGMRNITYHAGEDYYDILDGLRTIDETIMFMEYEQGDRIGHALALGKDVQEYYGSHDYVMLIPVQVLLDNLIWMKFYAMSHNIHLEPQTEFFIEQTATKLLEDIGYRPCSQYEYWRSMTLRGDSIEEAEVAAGVSRKPQTCKYNIEIPAPKNSVDLHIEYESNPEIKKKGEKAMELKIQKSFVNDVEKIQSHMLQQIIKLGITIETNPSSNCRIGGIRRYIDLPIFKFHRPDGLEGRHLLVTVTTDDRGVFYTNLRNEYSLLAIAMSKEQTPDGKPKYTMHEICGYIKKLVDYGNSTKFDSVKIRLPH